MVWPAPAPDHRDGDPRLITSGFTFLVALTLAEAVAGSVAEGRKVKVSEGIG